MILLWYRKHNNTVASLNYEQRSYTGRRFDTTDYLLKSGPQKVQEWDTDQVWNYKDANLCSLGNNQVLKTDQWLRWTVLTRCVETVN